MNDLSYTPPIVTVESTGEMVRDGAHSPAQAYRFKKQQLAPNGANF